jgi:hypothetical protein
MTKYLAGVLSVIAVGVLLVAYGLLNPRSAMDPSMMTMPGMQAAGNGVVGMSVPVNQGYVMQGGAQPVGGPAYVMAQPTAAGYVPVAYAQPALMTAPTVRQAEPVSYRAPAPRRTSTRDVERAPSRDWKRAAMIIGGSSATGAGVGAIFGGKKGALIGAAIAGGASTIYQTVK